MEPHEVVVGIFCDDKELPALLLSRSETQAFWLVGVLPGQPLLPYINNDSTKKIQVEIIIGQNKESIYTGVVSPSLHQVVRVYRLQRNVNHDGRVIYEFMVWTESDDPRLRVLPPNIVSQARHLVCHHTIFVVEKIRYDHIVEVSSAHLGATMR